MMACDCSVWACVCTGEYRYAVVLGVVALGAEVALLGCVDAPPDID